MTEIQKVTDPTKIVTDEQVLNSLAEQGIDKDYVEFWHDYASRSLGKEYSSYAKFYRDLKSNKRFMVVSGLPKVKPDGTKIEVGWLYADGKYHSKANLFSAIVDGKQVIVIYLSDQPSGTKEGEQVTWQPQLFLDGVEQSCGKAVLLDTDPTNAGYHQNVLEWDYGVCQRRVRVIEGRIRERWIFESNPHSTIRIKHNITGSLKLKLGRAIDAEGNRLKVTVIDGEEIVEANELDRAVYPVEIGASPETFYPDAGIASVDGYTLRGDATPRAWADYVAGAGTAAVDDTDQYSVLYIGAHNVEDEWNALMRAIILFDTSGLPDTAIVTAAILSLFGKDVGKVDGLNCTPNVNIYKSTPFSNTALQADDFVDVGNIALSSVIAYAAWDDAGYNDFTLTDVDTDDFGYISLTGATKLGTRNANYDVEEEINPPAPPNWVSGQVSRLQCFSTEKGAGFKPKLVVTYLIPQAVGGGSVGIAGALGRGISRVVGAGAVGVAGTLGRSTSRAVGEGAIPIAGSLERLILQGVSINDFPVDILKDSLVVNNRIEERSTAEFTIIDLPGIATYQQGQVVKIYDPDHTRLFSGVVAVPDTVRTAPSGELLHPIRCADNHYFADKRLAAESYLGAPTVTAKSIVEDLQTKYLAPEGITIGNIDDGADIVQAVFNYVRVSDALDVLAEKSGFTWFIDENKKLYFQARDAVAAPWALDGVTNRPIKRSTKFTKSNPLYRNRQYIRGGRGTTTEQTEIITADGTQVAFTVGYPFERVPTSVTDSVLGAMTIGIRGLEVGKHCYWNKGDPTLTFEVAPFVGRTITVVYFGQYPLLALAEEPVEIARQLAVEGAGTGYNDGIEEEPTLDEVDAVIDAAQAKLAKYGVIGRRFVYATTRSGLKPGQLQTITQSAYGLVAEEMLIESVTIRAVGENLTYDITVLQGPVLGSWSKMFQALAKMKQEIIDYLHVGSDQLLLILVSATENWEWEEDVPEPTVHTCIVCDGITCGVTRIVC